MEHTVSAECKQRFETIEKWQDSTDIRLRDGEKKDTEHDVDIGVLKTSITSLTNSMGKLTTAIWGAVISLAMLGLGFIIWFIQSGGL